MDLSAIYDLITDKLISWSEALISMFPNIILAVLILIIGFFIARWVRTKARKFMLAVSKVEVISNLFGSFMFFVFLAFSILTALKVLSLDQALSTVLAGAGILGLALAFAFQDIVANFVSGVILSIRLPMRLGHLVKIDDVTGTVIRINLRDTVIRTFHGQDVIIPNKVIFENSIKNYTSSEKRCIDLEVGVSYGDHLPDVKKITLNALKEIEDRLDEQGALFYYKAFGDSSIDFFVRLWLKETKQAFFLETRSQAIMLIKRTFDEHDLSMPYPVRTLDFDGKGGKNLQDIGVNIQKN